ncbi:hypothetical protein [Enterococcus durans]|nr:hypothetical protein [Enterococcus durans]
MLWLISMYAALKIEKIKKESDVQTYKEILHLSKIKILIQLEN